MTFTEHAVSEKTLAGHQALSKNPVPGDIVDRTSVIRIAEYGESSVDQIIRSDAGKVTADLDESATSINKSSV